MKADELISVLGNFVETGLGDENKLRTAVEVVTQHNRMMAEVIETLTSEVGTAVVDTAALRAALSEQQTLLGYYVSLTNAFMRNKYGDLSSAEAIKRSDADNRLDTALHALSMVTGLLQTLIPKSQGDFNGVVAEFSIRELREALHTASAVLDDAAPRACVARVANLSFRAARLAAVALEAANGLLKDAHESHKLDAVTAFRIASDGASLAFASALAEADGLATELSTAGEKAADNPIPALFAGTPVKGTA